MTRRDALAMAVKAMFAVLGIAFLLVLFRSLTGPSQISDPTELFDDVQYGQTALRRYQGQRVWATRLNPQLRNQLSQLDAVVADPQTGCGVSNALCVLPATTSRTGIELVYSEPRPPQIDRDTLWFGGLIDPTNNAVYDRLGRLYKGVGNNLPTALQPVVTD